MIPEHVNTLFVDILFQLWSNIFSSKLLNFKGTNIKSSPTFLALGLLAFLTNCFSANIRTCELFAL